MKAAYLGIAALGIGVLGLWYFGGGSNPPSLLAREGLAVTEPVVHRNLAVYFLRGPDRVDDSRVVTLAEALDRGWAVIHETGQVNELAVENLMEDGDLFLQSGDIIKGGRQDRMIASDMLVPPKSGRLPVASHCVEQGRWAGRKGEASTHFTTSDSIAVSNALKLANLNRDQSAVWQNVHANQVALSENLNVAVTANASPTSLQLALENEAVRQTVGNFEQVLRRAGDIPGVVGVVFVVNGQVTSAEVYGSNGLFRKVWPRLLKSAAVEAIATKSRPSDKPMSPAEVETFLLTANQPAVESVPMPLQQRRSEQMVLQSLNNAESMPRVGNIGIEGRTVTQDRVILQQAAGGFSGRSSASTAITNPTADVIREVADRLETNVVARPLFYEPPVNVEQDLARERSDGATSTTLHHAVDNPVTLQTETRVPGNGNALLHRSILKK